MALPDEAQILTTTLLSPSSLTSIISFADFKSLFPQSLREHPQVQLLYRDLQHQRAKDLDLVAENISKEARRGEAQQRELLKTRWRDGQGIGAVEDDMGGTGRGVEAMIYDPAPPAVGNAQKPSLPARPHTLSSILPVMENAVSNVQTETEEIEAEAEQLFARLKNSIGDLSDLRYGKFSRPELRNEALESLKGLESTIDQQSRR